MRCLVLAGAWRRWRPVAWWRRWRSRVVSMFRHPQVVDHATCIQWCISTVGSKSWLRCRTSLCSLLWCSSIIWDLYIGGDHLESVNSTAHAGINVDQTLTTTHSQFLVKLAGIIKCLNSLAQLLMLFFMFLLVVLKQLQPRKNMLHFLILLMKLALGRFTKLVSFTREWCASTSWCL